MSDEEETEDTKPKQRLELLHLAERIVDIDTQLEGVPIGVVFAMEVADPDGTRWFCIRSTDANADRDLYTWQLKGLFQHAIDTYRTADIVNSFHDTQD